MKYEVSKITKHNKKLPFLLHYSCQPWAQACYFVSESSVQSSSKLSLPPFVALSNFLIGQHPSLLASPFSTDSTIRLLFSIATRVFQKQITKSENQVKDILQVCEETENTMTEALSTLLEEIPDVTMWSRTKDILENGKLIPQAYKRKYEEILHSDNSIDTTTTETATADNYTNTDTANIDSNSNSNSNSNTTTNTNTNTHTDRNWEHVKQSLSILNSLQNVFCLIFTFSYLLLKHTCSNRKQEPDGRIS
ncbi:hypothetical protein INT47_000128 [Mucor saturninus]|uniref:Uncharacterized protein n=1 Tax=Mucor saturninus TaxID=64648 RepID=A0A8H7VC18_9FUNG|nr:hypothetical protein INT47_000128 [Mucor saturninus]